MPCPDLDVYKGKRVTLLLDATGYDALERARTSIGIIAKIVGITDSYVEVEDIEVQTVNPLDQGYKKAHIKKDYIIGIFEDPVEKE